ncbi:MAG: universal stress protein [Gammaproteobacteria bacterium]|nr:universal stress protein [Gammaproteobacteria bacterium]NNL11441.1 universal stress protein [Pseudomonadales bacterium]
MALSNIMAVLNPTIEEQPAFERALVSAEMTGAGLLLYICLNDSCGNGGQQNITASYREKLEALAERAKTRKVDASIDIDWDDNWREQVVVAAQRNKADLIIKHSVDHGDVKRAKHSTADWTLLRQSKCPVLMIKNHTQWESRRVLAAVVDKPIDAAHEKLNQQVIGFTNDFAETYQSEAHFVVAFQDKNHEPDAADIASRCKVEADRVHVLHGQTDVVITNIASEIKADLIVIGSVGRTGIKATVVGNTSERLLDHTNCDVLVLK